MSAGRVFVTVREALHATATGAKQPMKALAGELDYSPSEFSMRTTLGGASERPFPADDDHLVRLMKVTGDYSVLYTLADLCGFDVRPKERDIPRLMAEAKETATQAVKKLQQLVLELDAKEKRR